MDTLDQHPGDMTSCDRDRLVDDLRALAPAPSAAPLDSATRDRLEVELVSALAAASATRGHRLREAAGQLGPGLLVAACVTAVAGLGVVASQPDDPSRVPTALPVVAEADAVRALDGLATVALASEVPTVADDQFVYVRSTVISNEGTLGGPVTLGEPHEREIWLSQAAATDELGLIRESGQDWPITSGGYFSPAGPMRPTYRWLTSLPADPDDLITEIAGQQHLDSPISSDQYTFERIGEIISEGLVPPELSGTLFGALTKIPGVEHTEQAQDAVGRRGFGISRTDEFSGVTSMLVFRPGFPVPLGSRWYLSGREPGGAPELMGATAVHERGVADRLGVRPGERGPAHA